MRNVQQELRDRDRQLQQHILDKQKLIQRCNIIIQAEINKMTKEMQIKLQEQREQLTSCIKKKDDKLKLVRQILTSAREDTCDNDILIPPIALSSRIETTKKVTSIVPKKELSFMMPVNLQTSRSPCRQMRQTLFSRAISNNDIHEKTTEEPNPSLSKEESSTMAFMDSQISSSRDRIHQIPWHIRTDSDSVQRKTTKNTISMTVAESSMPSDSKTEIIEKSNSMTPIDSSSSTIASTNTIITKINFNKKDKTPVVNPRYQRVQNADKWINHRPARIVPTGTILQPRTQPHKRTIRKLTNPKDFMARSSRYCLLSQEQDEDGELETKLYKADVLPTCGGGAQIVFNDIECLKQISPTVAKCNGQKIGK
ncbi:Kinesin-like protein KIF23 [Trachymyrmex cornetzi]|uniref:Kinesin-like protein KIF23 n=2 Tax=Trachymyrmex cornetzi TaxID=471704 RepID=A0A195DL27_9HYME|nr:Kinesin-like protein KIF23 [Trachymyrmex cornetzi]